MKKYTVNIHYDAMIQVCVEAENEEQAIEYAREEAEEQDFDIVEDGEACIVAIEFIPPLDDHV